MVLVLVEVEFGPGSGFMRLNESADDIRVRI